MFERLNLPEGASVLDAGCGIGHVALYMARHGLVCISPLGEFTQATIQY